MTTETAVATPAVTAPAALSMRACVLREPGRPVGVETVTLEPPRAGEVLVRIAAAGVCHSDLHLVDGQLGTGPLADGARPRGRGRRGGGRRGRDRSGAGRSRRAQPGRPVRQLRGLPVGTADAVRAGRRPHRSPACWPTAPRGCAAPAARRSSTDCRWPALRSTPSSTAAAAIPIPTDVPLWQAALLGCGVVTGFGAVAHAAGVRVGERVCVIGCGGVGLQVIAAARLAGAATIVAVDRRPEKVAARPRPRRHRRRRSPARRRRGRRDRRAHRTAASTTRSRWSARRPRCGWPGTPCGRAGPPSSSAWRPRGVEVSLPAIEFLSEKAIVGSYFGSADPAQTLPGPRRARPHRPAGAGRHGLAPDRAWTVSPRRSSACAAARATAPS